MINLFLYNYEYKWLLDTKERDIQKKMRLFSYLFCFLDDLFAINNHLELDKDIKIYILQS